MFRGRLESKSGRKQVDFDSKAMAETMEEPLSSASMGWLTTEHELVS